MVTKHENIAHILRREIENGIFNEGERIPSEQELSQRFGVSTITVNKAVNLLVQEGVLRRSERTRQGTTVKKSHVFPSGEIAFLGSVKSNFYARMLEGALHYAAHKNYAVSLFSPDQEQIFTVLENIHNAHYKGILTDGYGLLPEGKLPTVYMDVPDKNGQSRWHVSPDSYNGSRKLMDALWRNGHRHFSYFMRVLESFDYIPHRLAVVDFLKEKGMSQEEIDARCFAAYGNSRQAIVSTLHKILRLSPVPSVIVCYSDFEAYELISVAKQLNIDLLKKCVVTGFGNVSKIQWLIPIPTVEQRPFDCGFRACEKLISVIENGIDCQKGPELIDTELVNEHLVHLPKQPSDMA